MELKFKKFINIFHTQQVLTKKNKKYKKGEGKTLYYCRMSR